MAADEPPYLTVGTDVSAKYKGAFCEAKIKKVNRIVKCKVTFKNSLGSSMVPDDQIRGTLRIGAEVEAVHPEKKQYLDAVINKMQDYSQYTVVFDDGDETTLRRTSLCLKSGRHFAESPTLDQFPLTNPEHFLSPVIGTSKAKRKRRSTMNSATLDFYSSDEDLIPKKPKFTRVNEKELNVGKVVCVDFGDRRKKDSWYPGVIVVNASSSARVNPKDEYLIRSFKDGKFNVVPKKDTRDFTRELCRKVENTPLRNATEKALLYFDKGELPAHWEKSYFGWDDDDDDDDLLDDDSDSDSSDSDDETDSEDSSDGEPSEEKDRFVAQLYKYMDERGTPINKAPTVLHKELNLYRLFKLVDKKGGGNRVTNKNRWRIINTKLGLPASCAPHLKMSYKRYLQGFEDFFRKLGCTMVNSGRASRMRQRGDRVVVTRKKDRDASSQKRKKEKNAKKKFAYKVPKASSVKKEVKAKNEVAANEEKQKGPEKKKGEKSKVEEKEEKEKTKKEETTKPRLVRSQSLNKDKKEKTGSVEKKETRNDRAKAREDAKKEKSESPEKKKETRRSSAKLEQEREKREKEPIAKKSEIAVKENVRKEDKPLKGIKEEKAAANKKDDTTSKLKKTDRSAKDKEDKKSISEINPVKDKKEKKVDDAPPKEKKFEVIKMDKSETATKDKKERQREVKLNRLSVELDEKPKDKQLKDAKVQLNQETTKDNPSKGKVSKDAINVKDDSFVKILCEIKEEKIPESDNEKDLFDFSSLSGRSGNDDEDYVPGKIVKKRRSTLEGKDDVKPSTDMFNESEEENPGPSSEKTENKDMKAKSIEINDKVKVKYGHGRTQKVYEAKVLKIKMEAGEKRYFVHYAGWNIRYDEWVRKSFIVENISEHNRSVRRKKQDLSAKNSSPPSPLKKNERGRLPGTLPAAKLHRKNSTSSTNSSTISTSRTTRSDKSGLHTSPFSRGLQPRKRTRKKSGVSLTYTDTSQDSESDEDSMMIYPDEDEEDIDTEGGLKAKEDLFSDDEEIQLETFRKLPDKECQKTDDEDPVSPTQEVSCKTPETPKSDPKSEITDKDICPTKSKTISLPEEKDVQQKVEQKPPEIKNDCLPPKTDNGIPFLKSNITEKKDQIETPVPILKKVEELVVESPRSISELIEMKYVEMVKKEPEIVEKQQKDIDQPRKLLDDKMPPLITYMGSFDKILSGASAKTKTESCGPTAQQSTLNLSVKAKEEKEVAHDNKNVLANNLSTCSSKIPLSIDKIETKKEPIPSPSKGLYFPMFPYSACNPRYTDPLSEASNKNILSMRSIQPFTRNISPNLKEPGTGIIPKSITFTESFRDQLIRKEQPSEEKICFPLLSKGTDVPSNLSSNVPVSTNSSSNVAISKNVSSNISSSVDLSSNIASSMIMPSNVPVLTNLSSNVPITTNASSNVPIPTNLSSNVPMPTNLSSSIPIPLNVSSNVCVPTNLSSNVPVKKVEKKKPYGTVIHNIPDFLKHEIRSKSADVKLRAPLPEPQLKNQRKPFDFSLSPLSKFRSSETRPISPQIDKYFSPFSNIKTLQPQSPLKSASPVEATVEVKPTTERNKLVEPSTHTANSFLNKSNATDFDALRNSSFQKKETTAAVTKSSESKEVSTYTSVIAFASSTASNIITPPVPEIKKSTEGKKGISLLIDNINTETDSVKEVVSENIKVEKDEVEESSKSPVRQESASLNSKMNSPEFLQQSLIELSIDEKGKELSLRSKQSSPTNSSSSGGSICNVFLNVSAEKSTKDVKELFSPQKDFDEMKTESDNNVCKSVISTPSVKSSPDHGPLSLSRSLSFEHLDSISSTFEAEKSGNSMLSKKEVKKKRSKTSKKSGTFESVEKEDKPKESKLKSKKKMRLDSEDSPKAKDTEMKSKVKKFKKNKNKKRFSRLDDHDGFGKTDVAEGGSKDASSEKIRKREKRKEKKFSKAELKYDEMADSKVEFSKKDRKKGKKEKEKMSNDKKTDLCGKKIRKKKKVHLEGNLDSDSEKESHSRLCDKKKKKEKKKVKPKDSSSSDDAAENRLLIDEEPSSCTPVQESTDKQEKVDDPDMSFLLCEEKVPASPVGANSLPDDTTGSSSLDENSNNRSPSSDEDRMQSVGLDIYPRAANLDMLETINKHNAEACAVLDNTPPTTPSSSPASIPSSSPSRDREPFLHYTESTQSGRESCEGELDPFRCGLNRTEMTETEEYRAAATLAFAVGQSISEKANMESYRPPPLKRQKSEMDDYSPAKRRKKTKRPFGVAEVSKIGNTRFKAASRSPKGESCDTYDSSNASMFTVGSPPHGSSASSALCTSFSHHSSPQISDASSLRASKSTFYLPLHEKDPEKRIAILQEKMSEMKKLYASLKAEVAQIDRRRKKARKKIREAAATVPASNTSAHGEEAPNCS